MGMSTHVIGFIPPDERWQAMKAAWEACRAAEVSVPEEIVSFFGYEMPDELGTEISMSQLIECGAICEWEPAGEFRNGYEVNIARLPEGVKFLRFYNSY